MNKVDEHTPVHLCLWSSQPVILIACDHSWTTPKWGVGTFKRNDVYITDDDRLYTFDEELVTCPDCQKTAADPELRTKASNPSPSGTAA